MRILALALLAMLTTTGCAGSYTLNAKGVPVDRGDGHRIWTFEVSEPGKEAEPFANARAVVFFLTGSLREEEPQVPVTSAMGALAGFAMTGMRVILVDRRGIEPNGLEDLATARRFSDKSTRVADALAALHLFMHEIPAGKPILLVGASEGADIAAAVAAAEPRVTHLLLLGGGGGMSQADELKLLRAKYPSVLGPLTEADLDAGFARVKDRPFDDALWLGQPYRRWASFLWAPPLPDLLKLTIPIFLGQGDADRAVPVESARAVQQAFAAAGKENLRYVEYKGLDHSFHVVGTGANAQPRVELDVIAWLGGLGLLSPADVTTYEARVKKAHPDLFP